MIPAFRQACADPTVRGHPLAVLAYLQDRLDVEGYRRVKVLEIAVGLQMREDIAARALRLLISRKYVAERGSRRQRTYRLIYSHERAA